MYEEVGTFFGGPPIHSLAVAKEKGENGKWLHIRLDGTPLYEERYTWAGNFMDGRALVKNGEEKTYLNVNGVPCSSG